MSLPAVQLPALSNDEDTFCLAVIEYGGNLGAAWRSVWGEAEVRPVMKAQHMVCRPEIAARIKQLSDLTQEHTLISLGSHLVKLAEIRDQAIVLEQMKVALDAEKSRGTVAGFYKDKEAPKDPNGRPSVIINMGQTAGNVQDWANQHGKAPIIIDMKP